MRLLRSQKISTLAVVVKIGKLKIYTTCYYVKLNYTVPQPLAHNHQ